MSRKLGKSEFPAGHSSSDFKAFGPPATKDSEFKGTKIADLGCFNQAEVDSNKYYHAAVVQSTKDSKWYAYFEWARTGAKNPQFQFVECSSESEACLEYEKQLHEKNDKRGEWINHPTLGRKLRARAGKDCYLVRPQATRSTGLPDARTIVMNEGAKAPIKKTTGKKPTADTPTIKLMQDLNVATVKYARSSIVGDTLPTQDAIDEARDVLTEAMKRVAIIGDDINAQVNDTELKQYTSHLYGRIPKKKDRGAKAETWILSKDNISVWQQDLDAFESALYSVKVEEHEDPFSGMRIKMEWIAPTSDLGKFIQTWMLKATRNRNANLSSGIAIKNMWKVEREGDYKRLSGYQDAIIKNKLNFPEMPLHQPTERPDIDRNEHKQYVRTNTSFLFHGSRSVNVSGILREGLRLPKTLVGVKITAWMMGPGLYFADDYKKSVGYTSHSMAMYNGGNGGVIGRGAFMFLADVVLGNMYASPTANGFTEAPNGFHSVYGKSGFTRGWNGPLVNNEFIVYNASQHALKYLVEFA